MPDWSCRPSPTRPGRADRPLDLHVHDTHFVGLACGVPKRVFAAGVEANGAVQYLTTSYLYGPGGPAVTCSSGAVAAAGRPFAHGFEMYFERATLAYHSAVLPLTEYTPDGRAVPVAVPGGGGELAAFTAELQAAVDGVRSGDEPPLLAGQLARDALVLCHREIESVRRGEPVAV